ncbi:hypothetical protein BDY21DRAFT_296292 [Lineolata rhizophorae]|uniref:ubiquitinyl hydrolase 1 n=1 Tax=Lineolata rhizophorae TaxID=578093 RepID=A0A6A6PBV3_9PEZI|nr:hypothetical protein BDY21DRAFT_296292 [Lineolata rhizophorae]
MAFDPYLKYIFHHVFLPPRLPQQDDNDRYADLALVECVKKSLREFKQLFHLNAREAVVRGRSMLSRLRRYLEQEVDGKLSTLLSEMEVDDVLPLHVQAQNAGLLIHRKQDSFIFMAFELSAAAESVMSAGRLRRTFPGSAVEVTRTRVLEPNFLVELERTLDSLAVEMPPDAVVKTTKAGRQVQEERDATLPIYVTELLIAILHANGHTASVIGFHKHVREDVLWDAAKLPWRRSPFWLLLRVSLQWCLALPADDAERCGTYKAFMAFFMSRILIHSMKLEMPSEMTYIMMAKVVRRLNKLSPPEDAPWLAPVRDAVRAAHRFLNQRWIALQQTPRLTIAGNPQLAPEAFQQGLQLRATSLRTYLKNRPTSLPRSSVSPTFTPPSRPRIDWTGPALPIGGPHHEAHTIWLVDVESWVADRLDSWVEATLASHGGRVLLSDHVFSQLGYFASRYQSEAATVYAGRPDLFSVMILTVMELWRAMDKLVRSDCSLLNDYGPGFSQDVFEPLLLRTRSQAERIRRFQAYIAKRLRVATYGGLEALTSFGRPSSLGVRFYDRSANHQALRSKIEDTAHFHRRTKEAELSQKLRRYRQLVDSASAMDCDYIIRSNNSSSWEEHQPHNCERCQRLSDARRMDIDPYEWPLPQADLAAKGVIFELDVPEGIAEWRDATLRLLNLLSPKTETQSYEKMYEFSDTDSLRGFVSTNGRQYQLRSEVKPFCRTHYKRPKVSSATESDVWRPHGARYEPFDIQRWHWPYDSEVEIRHSCTFQLPSGPYQPLQDALLNTTHTSNRAIAQSHSTTLDSHEAYIFGAFRAGHRLQLLNLARELVSPVLRFNREETRLLVMQALWQVGPDATGGIGEAHTLMEDESFGKQLLVALDNALGRHSENWQNGTAMRIFSAVARRLLSVTPHANIKSRTHRFLNDLRTIVLGWMRDLVRSRREAPDESSRHVRGLCTLDTALICYETLDVGPEELGNLFSCPYNVTAAIECVIHIYDLSLADTAELSTSTQRLLEDSRRLAVVAEGPLRDAISTVPEALDSAIKRIWNGYRPAPWSHQGSWLISVASRGATTNTVHIDMLSGRLIVNGHPLTRLPPEYESHETYRRLLGSAVVDIVPSRMPGMRFLSRNYLGGSQLHFGLDGNELIIRAESDEGIRELIPLHVLRGDFPDHFVEDFAHWLHLNDGIIEWRSLTSPWTPVATSWRLDLGSFTLRDDQLTLIDPTSRAAGAIHAIFKPIERPGRVHIFQDADSVTISLPRYRLEFDLGDRRILSRRILSRQYPGMWIDEQPSIGTLTGLRSRLTLRDACKQTILIPFGTVRASRNGDHVDVSVRPDNETHVYAYDVDRRLGRLHSDRTYQAKLFRCYLHALTSSCLPDELTGRTGTEMSLTGLRRAWARSFATLGNAELLLLEKLANLSPRLKFYPSHLRVMQQMNWEDLPSLSQHPAFFFAIRDIFQHAEYLTVFSGVELSLPSRNEFLLRRFASRQAAFRIEGFGAELLPSETGYSRDRGNSARQGGAWTLARLANDWSSSVRLCKNLPVIIASWGCVGFFSDPLRLGYHRDWLLPPRESLAGRFFGLQQELTSTQPGSDRFRIMFWLATLAFAPEADIGLCHVLLAFATVPSLRNPLPRQSYDLNEGYSPTQVELETIARTNSRRMHECPESRLTRLQGENRKRFQARTWRTFQSNLNEQVCHFSKAMMSLWPDRRLPMIIDNSLPASVLQYINVAAARDATDRKFRSWSNNEYLLNRLFDIQTTLDSLDKREMVAPSFNTTDFSLLPPDRRGYLRFVDVVQEPPVLPSVTEAYRTAVEPGVNHLSIADLRRRLQPSSDYEKGYLDSLEESLAASRTRILDDSVTMSPTFGGNVSPTEGQTRRNHVSILENAQEMLIAAISGSSSAQKLAKEVGLAPRVSPMALLERIDYCQREHLPNGWLAAFVKYGQFLRAAQRADRDLKPTMPASQPDRLLFELENDLTIRPVQHEIVHEMMQPSNNRNTVLQLDMGQGKTSVITPIVAAGLADGSCLLRVIVLRQLATPMYHLLADRLGGLLNRPIFMMPFNRELRLRSDQVNVIQATLERCERGGGVLLSQPEHLLSFELLVLDHGIYCERSASRLLDTRQWLLAHARDILDESDEILNVRFELVYTLDHQTDVEFAPNRWLLIQRVLGMLAVYATTSQDIIVHSNPGHFPRLELLNEASVRRFFHGLLQYVCSHGLPGLRFSSWSSAQRAALRTYLNEKDLDSNDLRIAAVLPYLDCPGYYKSLLVLRGLFAHGILSFCLHWRWRVHYGLDSARTRLAVPYRAKDRPAPRAEFSHPDVIIVLTCLSYYHNGLDDSQLRDCFDMLSRLDDSEDVYADWVRDAPALPVGYHSLVGVNLQDDDRCTRLIFPALRFAPSVVDFYVSHHVLVRELRAFSTKLAASGWDLARPQAHPTTGFSGTNDSRELLPATIHQADLPAQQHTNATVLSRLLSPDNSYLSLGIDGADALLDAITNARVLIDVGARVLEWTNLELASAWLQRSDAEAAVFFNDSDEVCVLDRGGRVDLLVLSPFARRLDRCVVYLDEVHTRGVDLQLPDCTAAVTLAPDLTKDRLVQACMRMRRLGAGQSMRFVGSSDVERCIKRCGSVSVADVVAWCIRQTWAQTRRCVPRWATQGKRFVQHQAAWSSQDWSPKELRRRFGEPDARSLEQMYGLERRDDHDASVSASNEEWDSELLIAIHKKCVYFAVRDHEVVGLEEEQERELSPETEREQQTEPPPNVQPESPFLHPDLVLFFQDGVIKRSNAFRPAIRVFEDTSAATYLEATAWPDEFIATADFCRTVVRSGTHAVLDKFLRPVHWVAQSNSALVIISPHEANEMLAFRANWAASMHIYAPRTSMAAWALHNLSFCAINAPVVPVPALYPMQLNLFAGQTVFDEDECISLGRFLGLCHDGSTAAEVDGYCGPNPGTPFRRSPIAFLRDLVAIRRGKPFDRSPLGRVLLG